MGLFIPVNRGACAEQMRPVQGHFVAESGRRRGLDLRFRAGHTPVMTVQTPTPFPLAGAGVPEQVAFDRREEIAADLYVSLNTLKTHLSNIYRKLEVTERNQAVARATELGLI